MLDSIKLPIQNDIGIIINKEYHPSHTTTTMVMSGKVMIPITTHHSEEWRVKVRLYDDNTGSVSVSEEYYNSINIDDEVNVDYTLGRFSNSVYIKRIW